MLTRLQAMHSNREYTEGMKLQRERLPSFAHCGRIVEAVTNNQVVVISGETGCGKTTQVPQFLLDAAIAAGKGTECRIICTQPRRISAVSVAERVASERLERVGGTVGYQIRLESRMGPDTRLSFCTTGEHGGTLHTCCSCLGDCTRADTHWLCAGVLLRRLQGDRMLSGVTTVIIDEIHERSLDSDFLLIIIRDLLPK